MLEGGGGGEVRHRRQQPLADREAPLGEPLEPLGRVAELVEAVVERPVLAAVHGLLADEAGDLALELRIGDLVAVVAHRPHEEVLAVGEHRRQRRRQVAEDEVAVGGEVLGQVLQRLLEGDAAGRDLAVGRRSSELMMCYR